MFSPAPESPLLVDIAITTGFSFLKCDFTAIVAELSMISFASFAMVLPVAGATTNISNISFGPSGSTS